MGIKQQIQRLVLKFLSSIVFTFFDLLDYVLCIVYSYLDHLFEGSSPSSTSCYCFRKEQKNNNDQVSTTLYRRQSLFRDMGCFQLKTKKMNKSKQNSAKLGNRWSDCGCEYCVAWIKNGEDLRLHLVVQDPAVDMENSENKMSENVIFLHGFISSSSLWTETVFCNLSEDTKKKYKLFAVDLLGFGRSPKPRDCLYTMRDHLEMIEKSVIFPFGLSSFHLVAHSMGSIIALALAAKYPQHIKSITLIAPPYFPSSSEEDASLLTLRKVADKRLWPPLVFGASFMSWYEHLGRTICFIICRNHRIWEFLLRLLTWRRDLHFSIMDITRHTHHSAWHTMHNVICGGAKFMEEYLTILRNARVKFTIIQGDEDQVLPVECSYNIKMRVPHADVIIIPKTSHSTIILRQIKELTKDLEGIWMSCH